MDQDKIIPRQFTILVVMFIIGSSILLIPAALAAKAKQDAWISAGVGVIVGLAIIVLLAAVGNRLPEASFIDSLKKLFGSWIGSVVGLLFVMHGLLLSVFMLRYIGDFMATQIMPDTPVQAIHILFIVLVVLASRHGLGTLARSAEIFLPWVFAFLMILIIFVVPQIQVDNLMPVLRSGWTPIWKGSLALIGIPYLELVLILMIYPHVDKPERRLKAFLAGGAIGGTIITIITLLTLSVLGPYLTTHNIYPSFALTKKINLGQFLQRVEALLAITWFLTIFYKTTIAFYVSATGLTRLLGLRHMKSVSAPLGFLVAVYALIVYPDIVYGIRFAGTIWTPYAAVFGLVIPIALLIATWLRRDRLAGGSRNNPRDSNGGASHNSKAKHSRARGDPSAASRQGGRRDESASGPPGSQPATGDTSTSTGTSGSQGSPNTSPGNS